MTFLCARRYAPSIVADVAVPAAQLCDSCVPTRSDVICEFPLKEMLAFHKERNAEGTLLVTKARGPGLQASGLL